MPFPFPLPTAFEHVALIVDTHKENIPREFHLTFPSSSMAILESQLQALYHLRSHVGEILKDLNERLQRATACFHTFSLKKFRKGKRLKNSIFNPTFHRAAPF